MEIKKVFSTCSIHGLLKSGCVLVNVLPTASGPHSWTQLGGLQSSLTAACPSQMCKWPLVFAGVKFDSPGSAPGHTLEMILCSKSRSWQFTEETEEVQVLITNVSHSKNTSVVLALRGCC